MDLVQVQSVNAFFGANQDMLIVSLGVNPRGRTMNPQGTAVENLGHKTYSINYGAKQGQGAKCHNFRLVPYFKIVV